MRARPALIAALAIGSIAAAAGKELPRGFAAEPMRGTGCEAFGPGFQKVEGTDTCIRLGGSVRVETGVATSRGSFVPTPGR